MSGAMPDGFQEEHGPIGVANQTWRNAKIAGTPQAPPKQRAAVTLANQPERNAKMSGTPTPPSWFQSATQPAGTDIETAPPQSPDSKATRNVRRSSSSGRGLPNSSTSGLPSLSKSVSRLRVTQSVSNFTRSSSSTVPSMSQSAMQAICS